MDRLIKLVALNTGGSLSGEAQNPESAWFWSIKREGQSLDTSTEFCPDRHIVADSKYPDPVDRNIEIYEKV